MSNTPTKYDLEERTRKFGVNVIEFCKLLPENTITKPLISQFVRAATSVGANYCEANGAESRKDFRHKMAISRKELKEVTHWVHMIKAAVPDYIEQINPIQKEADELTLIFSKIIITTDNKK